jgi:hypothetical protein
MSHASDRVAHDGADDDGLAAVCPEVAPPLPVDHTGVDRALEGWRRIGRGRHAGALNLGDLFAYALAASTDGAALCTGADFAHTDIAVVGASSLNPPSGAAHREVVLARACRAQVMPDGSHVSGPHGPWAWTMTDGP